MKHFPCTVLLLGSVLLMFGVELAVGAIGGDERLLALGAISDSGTTGTEYWRLLTYAWLHAGYVHVAANTALLWWVGRIVERRTGSLATLMVYVGCALAGGIVIMLKASMYPSPGVSLGASAAVSGLLACALVLVYRPSAAAFGQAPWVRATLWAILVCALGLSFLPGISLVGHIGGLVLGTLLGFLVPVRVVAAASASDVG